MTTMGDAGRWEHGVELSASTWIGRGSRPRTPATRRATRKWVVTMTIELLARVEVEENILLAGDTHGDLSHWWYLLGIADKYDVRLILQLGDFGYWPHVGAGVEYLRKLNRMLGDDRAVLWIDGNHDAHTHLRWLPCRPDGLVDIDSRITHVPRGARFDLAGTTFLGLGGANSIDKDQRIAKYEAAVAKKRRYTDNPDRFVRYEQWWAEEMITDAEVQRCVDGGPVEVVLAHDAPQSIDIAAEVNRQGGSWWKGDLESTLNRERLDAVLHGCGPTFWFHGHYHIAYQHTVPLRGAACIVRGLAANCRHPGIAYRPQASWWITRPADLRQGR